MQEMKISGEKKIYWYHRQTKSIQEYWRHYLSH